MYLSPLRSYDTDREWGCHGGALLVCRRGQGVFGGEDEGRGGDEVGGGETEEDQHPTLPAYRARGRIARPGLARPRSQAPSPSSSSSFSSSSSLVCCSLASPVLTPSLAAHPVPSPRTLCTSFASPRTRFSLRVLTLSPLVSIPLVPAPCYRLPPPSRSPSPRAASLRSRQVSQSPRAFLTDRNLYALPSRAQLACGLPTSPARPLPLA
ncbi:hypothetical protein C8Q77DRAFT_706626 [Trametes polyzona]|nr:hypothetical protein C8Q77DRAFT_706626 [Trametes polyzona]